MKTNIQKWAEQKMQEHRDTIRFYHHNGWTLADAVNYVLKSSVLGQVYKDQIKKEYGVQS